jgi:hypothetical protein
MAWKNFISPLAITLRRRGLASALVYGLSLSVRFTSAAGQEPEIPAPAAIMTSDGARIFYKEWLPKSAPSIAFLRGWPPGSTDCRAESQSSPANGGRGGNARNSEQVNPPE